MKKKKIILMIIILIILNICGFAYCKYILTRDFNVTINTSPFYFDASKQADTALIVEGSADVDVTIKNNDGTLYNEFNTNYEISVDNEKFTFKINNETVPENGVVSREILGNAIKSDTIKVNLIPLDGVTLDNEENVKIIVKAVSPYSKTIELPLIVTSTEKYVWDVSSTNDKSILATAIDEDKDGYYEVYIETQPNASANATLKIIYNVASTQAFYDKQEIIRNKVEAIHFVNTVKANNIADGMFAFIAQPNDSNSGVYNLDNLITTHCTSMKSMFTGYGGSSVDSISNLRVDNVYTMQNIFASANILSLDLNSWNTSKVTNLQSAFSNFNGKEVKINNWDTSNVTIMWDLFFSAKNIENLDLSNWKTSKVNSNKWMFRNMSSLINLDISGWDFSQCSSMEAMFYGDSKLETINLENVNTAGVKIMSSLFWQCQKLKSVDASSFNMSSTTSMGSMFANCNSVESITFSDSIDTSNVTDMSNMFSMCKNLSTVNVENFNTSKVTNLYAMFYQCYKIQNLDLSKWNTSNVVNFSRAFREMQSLQVLNISNFDFSSATSVESMVWNGTPVDVVTVDARNVNFVGLENTASFVNMFYGISSNTDVIVKDAEQASWFDQYIVNIKNGKLKTRIP